MPKSSLGSKPTQAFQMRSNGSVTTPDKTEIIRNLARKLYEKKGCQPGHDLENWLEAEKWVKSGKV
jgi:hypothetical protein